MENEQIRIEFSLAQIVQNQYSTFELQETSGTEIAEGVSIGFGYSIEDKQVGCTVRYQLNADEKPFLNIEITCIFAIADNSWEKLLHASQIILPKEFATHLAVITAGTTRGVLFANTRDTQFSNYPMSLIDITKIIKEDVTLTK